MQIVIEIKDELYAILKRDKEKGEYLDLCERAILKGTPLPKGHGRLIDADDLTWARHTVDKYGYEEDTVVSWDDIVDAPTIIEADKAGENNADSN